MLFNSYEFIFAFLPITFFIYFYLNNKRLIDISKGFLVFSSLFFYSWWNISYLPIILSSMFINYLIGGLLSNIVDKGAKNLSRKSVLVVGIIANLSLLGYFKYFDFFLENVNYSLGTDISLLHLTLPLAISFFTFQQIAYLVDSYRKETKEYDFLNYALFVTFFPQLIAGPIVHHKEMMPQFANIRNKVISYRNIAKGVFVFSIGLFKKVVIADTFSVWATAGFDSSVPLNFFEAWATSLSYTFQLYFDFSGYTDMAIGLALLFNIRLPINFNSPYKATNIQDFWRRWHITLSRFLKDYIYIPLGGNRKGEFRTYANLLMTFVLGGIWHGAGWTFVFWGFLHGIALVIQRAWNQTGLRLWKWLAWLITFNFVNIGWVFFRAKEWDDAVHVLSAMFSFDYIVLPGSLKSHLISLKEYGVEFGFMFNHILGSTGQTIGFLVLGFVLTLFFKNSNDNISEFEFSLKSVVLASLAFSVAVLSMTKVSEFLYFNF